MATPQLSVVEPVVETPGQKIKRLQEEARLAALEQIQGLERQLDGLMTLSREILEGGDAFPVGVRELCRNLMEEEAARRQTLAVILARSGLSN